MKIIKLIITLIMIMIMITTITTEIFKLKKSKLRVTNVIKG